MNNITCSDCRRVSPPNGLVETVQKFKDGSSHIRGECPGCRTFFKWIPYSESQTVKNILKYFCDGDMEALEKLRKTAVLFDSGQEII